MTTRITVLKGNPIVKELKAGAAGILPGHLLLRSATDGEVTVNGAAADVDAAKLFAVEADVIGNTAADAYAAGDQVKLVACAGGEEINARAAAAQTWSVGEALESAGGGRLQTLTTGRIIAYALEAIATPAADTLVRVEVA